MNKSTPLSILNPQLLGRNWENYEGTSSFGVFWRAMRLNNLHWRDLRAHLHLSLRAGDDAFVRLTHGTSQQAGLRFSYPELEILDLVCWRTELWWPFGGIIPFQWMPWRLRVCRLCARSCYHSLLFQMPGVNKCPWHGAELIDACPKCDRVLTVNVQHDTVVGRCRCGHDLVDFVASVGGEWTVRKLKRRAISEHLLRAASSRRRTLLIAPEEEDAYAWRALHWLVDGTMTTEGMLSERVGVDRLLRFSPGRVRAKSGLENSQPNLAALPGEWSSAFQSIGAEMLAMLPRQKLHSVTAPPSEARLAAGLLPAYPGGRELYISTEILDRSVLRLGGRLASIVVNSTGNRSCVHRTINERIRDHPHGLRLADALLRRIMTRGYADGLRVGLGRHFPALYDNQRHRPVRRLPWVLLDLPEGELPSARIGWTRQRGTF